MENKTLGICLLVSIIAPFLSGFYEGFTGTETDLTIFITGVGGFFSLLFGVWGGIRLFKMKDVIEEL